MKKKNIIFIGMPAVGKSTVGVDTDVLIQEQEGKLLRKIIEEAGEDGFLKIENQVNQNVHVQNTVISPGGSVVYCKEAMQHFKKSGIVVYLKASYETIEKRIKSPQKRGVVLRPGQSLRDLYEERTALFEAYADIVVSEDGLSLERTIEAVLEILESALEAEC